VIVQEEDWGSIIACSWQTVAIENTGLVGPAVPGTANSYLIST
jgi:hypothetical protein